MPAGLRQVVKNTAKHGCYMGQVTLDGTSSGHRMFMITFNSVTECDALQCDLLDTQQDGQVC